MKRLIKSVPLLQLGWVVAFSTMIPLGIGLLIDRRLGTAPLFILAGALLGIIAGTVGAVRIASRAIDSLGEPREDADGPDRPEEGKEDLA